MPWFEIVSVSLLGGFAWLNANGHDVAKAYQDWQAQQLRQSHARLVGSHALPWYQ